MAKAACGLLHSTAMGSAKIKSIRKDTVPMAVISIIESLNTL